MGRHRGYTYPMKWVLALILLPSLAAGEACLYEPDFESEGRAGRLYLLDSPACDGASLIYKIRWTGRGPQERDTLVADSWPGWVWGRSKCAAAARGLSKRSGTLVLVKTMAGQLGMAGAGVDFFEYPGKCVDLEGALSAQPRMESVAGAKAVDRAALLKSLIAAGATP